MADTDDDKLVQDANSNLVCTGYLSDHDSNFSSKSNSNEEKQEKAAADTEERGEYITLTPMSIRTAISARQLSQQLSQIQELEFAEETRNEFAIPATPPPPARQDYDIYSRDDMRSPVQYIDMQVMRRSPDEAIRFPTGLISPDMTTREAGGQAQHMRESPVLHYSSMPPMNMDESIHDDRPMRSREFISPEPPRRYPALQTQLSHPAPSDWLERHLEATSMSREAHPNVTSETEEVTSVTSSTEMGNTEKSRGAIMTSRVTSRRVVTSYSGKAGTPSPIPSPTSSRPKQPPALPNNDGLTHNELVLLERAYHESPYPSYQQLGKQLGITPFKVKCWFRKRRRNLHQESGAECSVEEETKAFKQFIVDHAAGRTIPSIMLPSMGQTQNIPVSLVTSPSTSAESSNSTETQSNGRPQIIAVPSPMTAPSANKRPREAIKEPKVATVRPSKSKSKKSRVSDGSRVNKPPPPMMQPVFPTGIPMVATGLLPGAAAIPGVSMAGVLPKNPVTNANQMPDSGLSVKKECATPSPIPSPAPSTHSDSTRSPEQTPLIFKNPQISELMQEREYLGRLLHEQQMQALETRKKLIDVDRELARVSAQLHAQFPYQAAENWAFMAAAHPQMMMIAQAQQQLLHAQHMAAAETQQQFLSPGPSLPGQNVAGYSQSAPVPATRSASSTPEPDGQCLLPSNTYGLARPDSNSDESNS